MPTTHPTRHLPLRIFYAVTVVLIVLLAWAGPLDVRAKEHVEKGLQRALVTFATARAANAIISMVQETQVSATPVGVGVTVSPGQALDPLNDLIEQFSDLMLAASVALGIQLLLITVGSHAAVTVALSAALLAWLALAWRRGGSPFWVTRIVVMALFVRFAVPLAALASEAVFELTLAREYQESQVVVDTSAQGVIGSSAAGERDRKPSLLGRLQEWFDKKEPVQAKPADISARLERAVHHVIKLMAVFVVQTILLPLAFLWIAYRVFRLTFSPRFAPRM